MQTLWQTLIMVSGSRKMMEHCLFPLRIMLAYIMVTVLGINCFEGRRGACFFSSAICVLCLGVGEPRLHFYVVENKKPIIPIVRVLAAI